MWHKKYLELYVSHTFWWKIAHFQWLFMWHKVYLELFHFVPLFDEKKMWHKKYLQIVCEPISSKKARL